MASASPDQSKAGTPALVLILAASSWITGSFLPRSISLRISRTVCSTPASPPARDIAVTAIDPRLPSVSNPRLTIAHLFRFGENGRRVVQQSWIALTWRTRQPAHRHAARIKWLSAALSKPLTVREPSGRLTGNYQYPLRELSNCFDP